MRALRMFLLIFGAIALLYGGVITDPLNMYLVIGGLVFIVTSALIKEKQKLEGAT